MTNQQLKMPPLHLLSVQKLEYRIRAVHPKGFLLFVRANFLAQMVKNGGKVLPEFSGEVTHVVSDLDEKLTTRRLGFKSINDVPKTLPILDYKWITKVVNVS